MRKRKTSCRDWAFSPSLKFEGFNVNEEIKNMMDGILEDESNGYKCNISNDATNDDILRRTFNSMTEGTNEEGNGE